MKKAPSEGFLVCRKAHSDCDESILRLNYPIGAIIPLGPLQDNSVYDPDIWVYCSDAKDIGKVIERILEDIENGKKEKARSTEE